jgi:hypothetical protein
MLTKVEGMIARRILVNYWLDPAVARRLVPEPLEPTLVNGFAVAGICLVRLEQMRPHGLPASLGITSENMAHRIAVRYPSGGAMKDGVYILRRDTDSLFASRLGGVLFPGTFRDAEFRVEEAGDALGLEVLTEDGAADVRFRAALGAPWKWTLLFARLADVCRFFQRADCGFESTRNGEALEGMRLCQQRWEMTPVALDGLHSAFYADERRFPRGSVGFDSAVLMRGIPHYWQALGEVPELASQVPLRYRG